MIQTLRGLGISATVVVAAGLAIGFAYMAYEGIHGCDGCCGEYILKGN